MTERGIGWSYAQGEDRAQVRVCADWREVPAPKLESLTQMGYELMLLCRNLKAQKLNPDVELNVSHVPENPGMLFLYCALMAHLQRRAERLPKENSNATRDSYD